METNTNKAIEFNDQWIRVCAGHHEHPCGWHLNKFGKWSHRAWHVSRDQHGVCRMPRDWHGGTMFTTLEEAKRAVNQYAHDQRKVKHV